MRSMTHTAPLALAPEQPQAVRVARAVYGVKLPAITGNPDFERVYGIQTNTQKWAPIFLPSLWLFAIYIGYVAASPCSPRRFFRPSPGRLFQAPLTSRPPGDRHCVRDCLDRRDGRPRSRRAAHLPHRGGHRRRRRDGPALGSFAPGAYRRGAAERQHASIIARWRLCGIVNRRSLDDSTYRYDSSSR
jgi:hypothetical protein